MRTEVRRGRKFIEYTDNSLPKGTFIQEISGADVSYRDETGKWKPISTKFSAKSGDFAFAADKLNHKIEVGNGGERRWYPRREVTDEYLTLGKPEYYNLKNDKWQRLNIIRSGKKRDADEDDTVELDTNKDLTVLMHSRWNGVKVDYVINSDKAPTRFRFPVGIVGLEYKDNKLYGKDGELVGILTPTIARDANDKELSAFGKYDGEYLEFGVEAADDAAYPITLDPDFSGDTADGYVNGQNTTYSTARSTSYNHNNTLKLFAVGQELYTSMYYIYRSFLKFDTSSITESGTITQVNLKLTVNSDYSEKDFDVQIVKQDWSGQDPLSSSNRETAYDNCLSGDADDNIWRNTKGISANSTYTSGKLSTSWINKTGNTYYSLRSSRDKNANTPTGDEYIHIYSAESTTASYRPVLVVVYTASQNYTLTCAAGSYSLTGTAATLTVQRNYVLSCGAGSYNLTGTNADLKVQRNYTLSCNAGSYALTGSNADLVVQRNYTLVCGSGSYALTGTNANLIVQRNYTLTCEAGSYALTGTNADLVIQRNYTLNCEAGVYVLTGSPAALNSARTMVCDAGSYALTGTDANFIIGKNYTLLCNAGSYALTGTDADLTVQRNYTLVCEVGSYALTGTAVTLIVTTAAQNLILTCEAGSYALTGSPVTLEATLHFTLNAEAGSYALTGSNVDLVVARSYTLSLDAGTYALTGTGITFALQRNYTLVCEAGTYSLTGSDVAFFIQRNYTLAMAAGSYSLTGSPVMLNSGRTLSLEPGNYALIGSDVGLFKGLVMPCSAGNYALTGSDISMTANYIFALGVGDYVLVGTNVGFFILSATPECRVYNIKHETRTHTIEHEKRTLEVKC